MKDIYCTCGNRIENEDTGLCASCSAAQRKSAKDTIKLTKQQERKKAQRLAGMREKRTPIKKASDKRKDQMSLYAIKRKLFLKGKRCVVFPERMAVDVHHARGRSGDLLLDERFWKPVCREGHMKIHDNPEWAISEGYSISRNKIQQA